MPPNDGKPVPSLVWARSSVGGSHTLTTWGSPVRARPRPFLVTAALTQLMRTATVVDLSVTTSVDLPCSPPEGQPPAQFLLNTYTWPRGPFLEYVQVHDDHTGTHIDAPAHFTPRRPRLDRVGVTIEQLPLDQLMGPAAVDRCPPPDRCRRAGRDDPPARRAR